MQSSKFITEKSVLEGTAAPTIIITDEKAL
jgi:hypothetical protein